MKKRMYIMVFVFSVLCGFIFAKYTVEAKTIFIKGGNQSTIQNKIKQLGKKGGTIILRKGTYRFTSTLKLSSKITLKAKGKVRIISKTKKPTIVIAGGNKISIQGIEFRGAKKGPYISLMKARNVSVNKCTFRGGEIAISSTWGLDKKGKLQFQTGVKITNNRFASQSKASVKAVV